MRPSASTSTTADHEPEPPRWDEALARVLADGTQPRLFFQPIVDLERSVVAGYEALSRFAGPPQASPDRWFDAAEQRGRALELELRAVERALEARPELPPNTFLTVNMTPAALLHPSAREVLERTPGLHRLVFEVTEHEQVTDYHALRRASERVHEAGGLLAVDDAGSGYASLKHVLELRPDFVKLDRELITGLDRDPVKRSVVQMLGELTDKIDAWLIAEGIETLGELDTLVDLHVPLGQGWVLGRPDPAWSGILEEATSRLELRRRELGEVDRVATLLERRPALPPETTLDAALAWFRSHAGIDEVVQLDAFGRPVALLRRADVEAGRMLRHPVLVVAPSTRVAEVAKRAINREAGRRFDPVACGQATGAYAGVVTLERLVEQLADDPG